MSDTKTNNIRIISALEAVTLAIKGKDAFLVDLANQYVENVANMIVGDIDEGPALCYMTMESEE